MTEHRIGTQKEWQAERDELLKEEKELTRRADELARKRKELPWVPVEKDYRFEAEDGTKTLADLVDGRSQSRALRLTRHDDTDASTRNNTKATGYVPVWRAGAGSRRTCH